MNAQTAISTSSARLLRVVSCLPAMALTLQEKPEQKWTNEEVVAKYENRKDGRMKAGCPLDQGWKVLAMDSPKLKQVLSMMLQHPGAKVLIMSFFPEVNVGR